MIDTDKEARDYFHHNPETEKVHFIMVTDEDYDLLNEEGIIDLSIIDTETNERA